MRGRKPNTGFRGSFKQNKIASLYRQKSYFKNEET